MGAPAAPPPAATRLQRAPSFRRLPSSRRAEALWEYSGSGWRPGRVRRGRPLLSWPRGAVGSRAAAVESAAVSVVVRCSCVWVRWWVGMVVRFVCVIRVPVCARVSRVCPGSPFLPYKDAVRGRELIIFFITRNGVYTSRPTSCARGKNCFEDGTRTARGAHAPARAVRPLAPSRARARAATRVSLSIQEGHEPRAPSMWWSSTFVEASAFYTNGPGR
jgi:hypothetical protein